MKQILLFTGIIAFFLLTAEDCDKPNSDKILAQGQEQIMMEANRQVGMPAIKNFTQRKQLKMIQELCDQENLICYAYIVPEMTGKPVFLGKCIGFGIPYATEYTNPMKLASAYGLNDNGHYTDGVIPQADPNGLFMPASAEGTWLLLIDPSTNEPHPVYVEPRVLVSPFKLSQ